MRRPPPSRPPPILVGVLALTVVLPQAHAQGAGVSAPPAFRASFGLRPLAPPRHAALAPGGRLGARVPAGLVAARWLDAVLAARATGLAPPPALAAAPPPGIPAAPAAKTASIH